MSARIYDRPDLDQVKGRLPLFITGSFATGRPVEAYEGRLQIHNGVGGMTVERIDGDPLPNGYSLYIAGSEVVLAWPAYSETAAVIPNPGYEDGDTSWEKGSGWTIGTENPITGLRSARYGEMPGSSLISNTARYPITPGREITASCNVRQGASSEGNAGAAVQLEWRGSDGALLGTSEGNAVMSASKNRVYPSTVTAAPLAGAELVNVAARGIRNRENKPLFIDDFAWDHVQTTGANADRTYALTLRVRDSAGRSVIWTGTVRIEVSPDYPVVVGWDGLFSSAFAATATAPIPATVAGDRLVMMVSQKNNSGTASNIATPAGWTLFGSQNYATDSSGIPFMHVRWFYRDCDGSEGLTVSLSANNAGGWGSSCYRIQAGSFSTAHAPVVAFATANSSDVNAPALVSPWGSRALHISGCTVTYSQSGEKVYPLPANQRTNAKVTVGGNITANWACTAEILGDAPATLWAAPTGAESIRRTIASTVLVRNV